VSKQKHLPANGIQFFYTNVNDVLTGFSKTEDASYDQPQTNIYPKATAAIR
jgi:hypothetical protein